MTEPVWKAGHEAMLRAMREKGETTAEIARALGRPFTRNAVIGKINRLGLARKKEPWGEIKLARLKELWVAGWSALAIAGDPLILCSERSVRRQAAMLGLPQPTPRLPSVRKAASPRPRRDALPHLISETCAKVRSTSFAAEGGITLPALREHHCRMPLWGDRNAASPRLFCAAIVEPGATYCPHHHRLCHDAQRPIVAARAA